MIISRKYACELVQQGKARRIKMVKAPGIAIIILIRRGYKENYIYKATRADDKYNLPIE